VRVLLDSNLPRAFAALLPGHRTETTHSRGWSDLDDGPLLNAAESEFDVFISMDQNIRFQQNLRGRTIRIVIVRAASNRLVTLAPAAPLVLQAIATMDPGQIRIVALGP